MTSESTAATTDATTESSSESTPSTTEESSPAPNGIPPATIPPDGLGDDPVLQEFAQQCYDGQMFSCDVLFTASEDGSPYKNYADTCAGRQPAGTGTFCTIAFPES